MNRFKNISVEWDIDKNDPLVMPETIADELRETKPSIKLSGKLRTKPAVGDETLVRIPLNVDGYPRAYTLEIICKGNGDAIPKDATRDRKLVSVGPLEFIDEAGNPLPKEDV